MSTIRKSNQIARSVEHRRNDLRNRLLARLASEGTYTSAVEQIHRPHLAAAMVELGTAERWGIDRLDEEIEERSAGGQSVDATKRYVDGLDQFLIDTLSLSHGGAPATWAREAVHRHVSMPRWPWPFVPSAAFQFSRDLILHVRVSEDGASLDVMRASSEADRVVTVNPESPWLSFTDWPTFADGAVEAFLRELENIRTEMMNHYYETDSFRRRGGLKHEYESVDRLARILLSPPRSRNAVLTGDFTVKKVRSEKQTIRALCLLIGVDSPFSRRQKK